MIGQTISHYRILEKLGGGGMGVVYKAEDTKLGRLVALKFLPEELAKDSQALERFRREARAASALNHPHICTIHEVGEADGRAYIVMEYVEGQTLKALVAAEGLAVETVIRYGTQIADGLAHAHQRGIVHRDLKSSNMVITPEGRAKVLDFGLARRLDDQELAEATRSQASLSEAGAVMGTLQYLAPEVLRGQPADERSDLWALGVVLYELAAGELPFRGRTGFDLTSAILLQPPAPVPSRVPVGLRAVIQRCLAKEPGQRYERASEVRAALEALQPEGVLTTGKARPPRLKRRGLLATSMALGVLVLVVLFYMLLFRGAPAARPPKIRSLAVLPLENLSRDPEQEYFADGMTDALIGHLAQIEALRVISRTSIMQYKGAKKSLPQIAHELNVDAVVEGTVLRSGERVRITAQLIEAATDQHLWAKSYERDLRDILALQGDVARAIADEIQVRLTPQERVRLSGARPVNPEAYEDYLKGVFYWNKFTVDGIRRAVEHLERAIQKDPGYAPAYSWLADSYAAALLYGGDFPPRETNAKLRAAASKALEIDDNLAEAHTSLAFAKLWYEWDWPGAEREYKRAIELNPSSAIIHTRYSLYLNAMGRLEEAIREARKGQELDPLSPLKIADLGDALFFARRYDQAIEQYQKAIEIDPNFPPAHQGLGHVYEQQGQSEKAIASFQRAWEVSGGNPALRAEQGHAYALAGKRAEALKVIDELKRQSKQRYVSSYNLALVYIGLGDKDQALAWLEKAYEERYREMVYLKVDPRWSSLQSDPRFQALVRRVGLTQ